MFSAIGGRTSGLSRSLGRIERFIMKTEIVDDNIFIFPENETEKKKMIEIVSRPEVHAVPVLNEKKCVTGIQIFSLSP